MKYIWLYLLVFPQLILAQQKELSLTDAILGKQSYLSPETIEHISWRSDAEFTFVDNNILKVGYINSNSILKLISLSELNNVLGTSLFEFPEYSWLNNTEILIEDALSLYIFSITDKEIVTEIELGAEDENAEYCVENRSVAYTIEDDLFVTNNKGERIAVTNDGGNGIVNGKYVHRREFGIKDGIFWSPNGNLLAFYRKDETMVANYPLVDYMARVGELNSIKYPMAGMKSHHVKVGVYNMISQKTIFLETDGPADHYLTNIAWSPDEKSIYVAEVNREQNHMKLNQYDANTGKFIQTLFEEKHDKYVEPMTPVLFSNNNPEEFYYLSRRDGWFHVYQYNTKGKLLKQITNGEWEVTKLLGFDLNDGNMFFEATKESPLQRHIYKVNIKSGNIVKLSQGLGVHTGLFNPSFNHFIDEWSGTNTPGRVDLNNSYGDLIKNLVKANDPLEGCNIGTNEIITIKAADNKTDLYGRLIKPADFDSTKKYPVIIYVYGGPHLQLIDNSWHNAVRWWHYYMAEKGYILFTLDSRGSANRGLEFENVIHRNLGVAETADQMKGLEYLKELPYVDSDRIGVHGWSYGGFLTLNLKLRYPDIFKVAVAGGPVVDWNLYETMYGERYMDTPKENPKGYEQAKMLNYIGTLQGKLMLVHGAQDETVVMQHSMKFIRECIRQGKQVDFFVYPTHPHNVSNIDRVHLMEKVSNYFLDNL